MTTDARNPETWLFNADHDWRHHAACAQLPEWQWDAFFELESRAAVAFAKRTCASCPVLAECRACIDGFESHPSGGWSYSEEVGIWAGETPKERRERRRRQRASMVGVVRWETP